MLELSKFRWSDAEHAWIGVVGQYEVVIFGDEVEPDITRVNLAESVVPNIDELTKTAVAHLEFFANRPRFAVNSQWAVQTIEFGRHGNEPLNEFAVYLSLLPEDQYGLWKVTLRRDERFGPQAVEFSRRQV
jgi:hypothetical protein